MNRTLYTVLWLFMLLSFPEDGLSQLRFRHLTVNDGLSQNTILCLLQDRDGFIWMGTADGLNRFDGYEFKHFKHDPENNKSISNNSVNALLEDKQGNLWVATSDGLNTYHKKSGTFSRVATISSKGQQWNRDFISALFLDDQDQLWIGTIEGLKRYDLQKHQIADFAELTRGNARGYDYRPHAILKDRLGRLWFGTTNGLQCFDASSGQLLALPASIAALRNFYIRVIRQDPQGRIWFGSESDGVFVFDPFSGLCQRYIQKDGMPRSLPGNTVRDIYFSRDHRVWIGTLEGLSILDLKSETFNNQFYNPENPNGIGHNSIRSILQDNAGNIWLGTYAGGVNTYYPNSLHFDQITEKLGHRNGLSHPVVSSILESPDKGLWIGTEGGGLNYYNPGHPDAFYNYTINMNGGEAQILSNIIKSLAWRDSLHIWVGAYNGLRLFDCKSKTFKAYSIGDDTLWGSRQIYALLNTANGLWIGTNGGGLRLLDGKNHVSMFMHEQENPHSISDNSINVLIGDVHQNLWIGTQKGLNYFDTKKHDSKTYHHIPGDKNSLSNNAILSLYLDSKKRLWVGTDGGGLNILDEKGDKFCRVGESNGLNSGVIHSIREDPAGTVWISTNAGLSAIRLKDPSFAFSNENLLISNYTTDDGLQSNQFSTGAALHAVNGTLYFGGIRGISTIYPQKIMNNTYKPNVVFTEVLVKNHPQQMVNSVLLLPHDHGSVTFKFAALNYVAPSKNKYAYKMDGLTNDDSWHTADASQRIATYINLTAGTYHFRVKAANNDGLWGDVERTMTITVLPPLWKTWWAYLIYFLFFSALLYLFYYYTLKTAKLKNELEYEHLTHEKDQQLAQQKINFFTNISHEIKTPLTLILVPLEKMIKQSRAGSKLRPQLEMMHRNGERLNRLINQLLDFRKFESGKMLLKNTENDLVRFLQEICILFESFASHRHIDLIFDSSYEELLLWFDGDKMEKIMYNLLSNAVKFSNEGGKVYVRLRPDTTTDKRILIDVEDHGIGIPAKNQQQIFEQFHHNTDKNMNSSGTGIGLAFSKGLIELMGGSLSVQSEVQEAHKPGSTCFTIHFPVVKARFQEASAKPLIVPGDKLIESNEMKAGKKAHMLVVEDNRDLLDFMTEVFSADYQIHTACDGKEGLEKAVHVLPDIIISDVMMPIMNGIEFCKKIKADVRTSQIPFVLLTARTPVLYKIEGFGIGADDYITKPFRMDVLEARVHNLIDTRRKLMRQYKTIVQTQPREANISSPDDVFLDKVMCYIEENLSEPILNVEEMARDIGMGRGALYRRIKALTGQTAIEFIRAVRIKRAAQLLKQKNMNVSEVVYSVGFTDLDYFRKCFKKQYGVNPKEYGNS